MPMGLVEEHVRQMPMLQAREALHLSTVAAVGQRGAKDAASVLRVWRREAGLVQVRRPKTVADFEQQAAAHGIAVVKGPCRAKKS